MKKSRKPWKWMTLGDIGKICSCREIPTEQILDCGDIPLYKIGTLGKKADAFISEKIYNEYKNKYPYPKGGDVLITVAGTIGRTLCYYGEKAYFQGSRIVWIDNNEKKVLNRFLYHWLSDRKWAVSKTSTIPRLNINTIQQTAIHVPPFIEQIDIISKLDTFEKLVNDTNNGIQAEIQKRREQYNFYLNKIMDFKLKEYKTL